MQPDDAQPELNDDSGEQVPAPFHNSLPHPPEVRYSRPTLGLLPPKLGGTSEQGRKGKSSLGTIGTYGANMSAGITFASSIVVGFLIGQYADMHWVHSQTPWATLAMTLAGIAAGFINLFRMSSAGRRK
jgi:F0F1-type ATP synthase assembly protein I